MIDKNIQQIPSDWKIATLGEVLGKKGYIRGPFGSSLKRNELRSEGIPVYEQQNAIYDHRDFRFFIDGEKHKELSRFTVKENDLIVSCSGTLGKVSLIKNTDLIGIISQALLILRSDIAKILPKYLYYFLISPEGYNSLLSRSTGSVQVNLANRNIIESIELDLPSLPEQRAIASVLSAFDDKIELLREQNKTLSAIAQTLFNRWFVEFNFPDENGQPYRDSGGKMIDSELGEIPEGWRVGKLEEIVDIYDSKRIPLSGKQRAVRKGQYPYYGATEVMDYIDDYLFEGIYLLLAEDGSVIDEKGFPVLQYVFGQFWVNNHAHVIQGKQDISTEYLYLLFKQTPVSGIITGAVQLKINQGNLLSLEVTIPEKQTLKIFNNLMDSFFSKIRANIIQIQTLSQLRDTLLPKLMCGKVRVKGFSD